MGGAARIVIVGWLAAAAGCIEDRVLQPLGSAGGNLGESRRPDGGAAGDPVGPSGGSPAGASGSGGAAGGGYAGRGAAGMAGMAGARGEAGAGGATSAACDMTGQWIEVQVAFAEALGARQTTVNWIYYEIAQHGDVFTATRSLNCGLRVTGTTTVTLSEETMEALAIHNPSSQGRKGTFVPTPDGTGCRFDLDRAYNLRGAHWERFLADYWMVGDPPRDLTTFPPLPMNAGEGMEDWDGDGIEGITLRTSLGDRYVAQRDWNEEHGTVPASSRQFGGEGVVVVTWDGQEAVSEETNLFLRTSSTPLNPGRAWWIKVDGELQVVTDGPRPELETCRNVQRLALEKQPNP